MNDQQNQNEAACGGSALTAVLGALADQFECHALSRSIDDIEAAGRAMRDAKAEIKRMRERLIFARAAVAEARVHFLAGQKEGGWTLCALRLALDEIDGGLHDPVPNLEVRGGPSGPSQRNEVERT